MPSAATPNDLDRDVRYAVYTRLATSGRSPDRRDLVEIAGDLSTVDASLRRLHDAHAIVLGNDGEVAMALPFAGRPTIHRVDADDGRQWWANCAWDALAIPLLVGTDAEITAPWLDDETTTRFRVSAGEIAPALGFVHFARPAAIWWDDIVET